MKKILVLAAILVGPVAFAQDYEVSDVNMSSKDGMLTLTMQMDLSQVDPDRNTTVTLVPVLYHGENSQELTPVGLFSRGQFYRLAREKRERYPLGKYQWVDKENPGKLIYTDSVPYKLWMDGATVRIDTRVTGCCGKAVSSSKGYDLLKYLEPDPDPIPFVSELIYVEPEASVVVKERSIKGEAYVTFQAGASQVLPEYQSNAEELAKIRSTVESVKADEDLEITSMTLVGYSSPDGKYAKNEVLSQKRTEAIRAYVSKLFKLPKGVTKASSVAENWDGLRAAVVTDELLQHKDEILSIIDSDLDPDVKESKIKAFKSDYAHLSADVFPLLRRTDYKVDYTVRSYTSPEEIRRVMLSRPQNLSINEFFFLSKEYKPGTPEFNQVFAVMASVYPDDPVANVNAASAAMSVGDLDAAAGYLAKAGNGGAAEYTRGELEAIRGNYADALDHFKAAAGAGIAQAPAAVENVRAILDRDAFIAAKRARQQ